MHPLARPGSRNIHHRRDKTSGRTLGLGTQLQPQYMDSWLEQPRRVGHMGSLFHYFYQRKEAIQATADRCHLSGTHLSDSIWFFQLCDFFTRTHRDTGSGGILTRHKQPDHQSRSGRLKHKRQ